MEAFQARGVACYAVFAGNQLLHPYRSTDMDDAADSLGQYLERLSKDHTAGHYTICVYEDLPDNAKITNKTPYDGSFNFILHDYQPEGMHRGQNGSMLAEVLSELKAMRLRQEELERRLDEEPEPSQDALGRILENPVVQQLLPMVIQGLQGLFQKKQEIHAVQDDIPESHKIAGIPAAPILTDKEKVDQALKILMDKDFPNMIYKLAQLKQKSPLQYRLYETMLKQMKL